MKALFIKLALGVGCLAPALAFGQEAPAAPASARPARHFYLKTNLLGPVSGVYGLIAEVPICSRMGFEGGLGVTHEAVVHIPQYLKENYTSYHRGDYLSDQRIKRTLGVQAQAALRFYGAVRKGGRQYFHGPMLQYRLYRGSTNNLPHSSCNVCDGDGENPDARHEMAAAGLYYVTSVPYFKSIVQGFYVGGKTIRLADWLNLEPTIALGIQRRSMRVAVDKHAQTPDDFTSFRFMNGDTRIENAWLPAFQFAVRVSAGF